MTHSSELELRCGVAPFSLWYLVNLGGVVPEGESRGQSSAFLPAHSGAASDMGSAAPGLSSFPSGAIHKADSPCSGKT